MPEPIRTYWVTGYLRLLPGDDINRHLLALKAMGFDVVSSQQEPEGQATW